MSQQRLLAGILLCLLTTAITSLAQGGAVILGYDLRPGDHLIYRETLERSGQQGGEDEYEFHSVREWTTHVLVTARERNSFNVGFQRNRTRAELLRFERRGKDERSTQQPLFAEQVARSPEYYSEANRLNDQGWPLLPPQVVREAWSQLLFDLRELMPLPRQPVRPGDTWKTPNWLGLEFRASGWGRLLDQDCLRVDASHSRDPLRLRYWFCPESGRLARLEFDGAYSTSNGEIQEKLTFELLEGRRDEEIKDWLLEPELRRGVLASLLVSDSLPVDPTVLYTLLEEGDPTVQRQVLALVPRYRIPPPPTELLAALLESEDPRVRTLSLRALERLDNGAAKSLVETGLTDADYFVHQAALDWVRDRLPLEMATTVKSQDQVRAAWASLNPNPIKRDPAISLVTPTEDATDGNRDPGTRCGDSTLWSETALHTQRFSNQPPGTTIRTMRTEDFWGWPYAIHVPEDYRGNRPFPLLIYLSGGAGRTLDGALTAREMASRHGFLVLFPDARRYWWNDRPAAMVHALLSEVLRTFNVDPNRVYLAGFSNGGTGAIRYASWWRDRLAAAAFLMGAGSYSSDESEPPLLINLLELPLLFLHGEQDKRIPLRTARETVDALRQLAPDGPVVLHIFPDRGHDVVLDADEGMTAPFLQQHERDPFPRQVVFQARDLRYPRHFWLEILDKKKGLAKVQGHIEADNTIRIDTHGVKRLRLLLRPELLPREGQVRVVLNGKKVFDGLLAHDCGLLQESWQESADPFLAHSAELVFDVP
jgi:pimeloyl-ACP methyl ester carboxylesterase